MSSYLDVSSTILVDAAVEMVEKQRHGLDDLVQQDIKELTTKVGRLKYMLTVVTDIVDNLDTVETEINLEAGDDLSSVESYWT